MKMTMKKDSIGFKMVLNGMKASFLLAVCGLGWLEWREVFSAKIIQGLMLLVFYMYFVSAIASNYSTITNPKRVNYGAIVVRSFRQGTYVFCLFATAVPVLIYSFLWNDLRLVATGLSFIAIVIYFVSLEPLSRKLAENKEDFVHEISG